VPYPVNSIPYIALLVKVGLLLSYMTPCSFCYAQLFQTTDSSSPSSIHRGPRRVRHTLRGMHLNRRRPIITVSPLSAFVLHALCPPGPLLRLRQYLSAHVAEYNSMKVPYPFAPSCDRLSEGRTSRAAQRPQNPTPQQPRCALGELGKAQHDLESRKLWTLSSSRF
jgi:hypothetical protein